MLIGMSDRMLYWLLLGLAAIVFLVGWLRLGARGSALHCASSATTRSSPSTAASIPRARQGDAVRDLQHVCRHHRRAGGRRAGATIEPTWHSARSCRSRSSSCRCWAARIACGDRYWRHSLYAVVGFISARFPGADNLAARRRVPADRLRDPAHGIVGLCGTAYRRWRHGQ